jgi:hypothetical protein
MCPKKRSTPATERLLICTLSLMLLFISANAQKPISSAYDLGFGASFGVRSYDLKSNVTVLNSMDVLQEGGTLMAMAGNRVVRGKLECGFYYSGSSVPNTINTVELGATFNLYPLQLFTEQNFRIEPYLVSALSRAAQKYYGFYQLPDHTDAPVVNYSTFEEPYLGSSSVLQGALGLGMEYHITGDGNFVHFFAEARNAKPLHFTSSAAFEGTTYSRSLVVNLGVVFGLRR